MTDARMLEFTCCKLLKPLERSNDGICLNDGIRSTVTNSQKIWNASLSYHIDGSSSNSTNHGTNSMFDSRVALIITTGDDVH